MNLGAYFEHRGLLFDDALQSFLQDGQAPAGSPLEFILDAPDFDSLSTLHSVLPPTLVPLVVIDDVSVACLAGLLIEEPDTCPAPVVRYFVNGDPPEGQRARLLDIDADFFLSSWEQELASRHDGLCRVLDEIGPAYEETHLSQDKRPRDFVIRPVRVACQNVIVALAGFCQDSTFDGLSVVAWQTCELPHIATHEGNRALAALTLCDAFQSGGTMEIRFDRPSSLQLDGQRKNYDGHPERRVPASLRRFGRTVGVALGADDRGSISPTEARELFLAITPMPQELRQRVYKAILVSGTAPERVCYTLLSQIWREIELDFLLATTTRTASILRGGAPWSDRLARQSESESCRAAIMLGMFHRRLLGTDAASADGQDAVRVVEDAKRAISWSIDESSGSVSIAGLEVGEHLPWSRSAAAAGSRLTLYLSPMGLMPDLTEAASGQVALVVPADAVDCFAPAGVVVLRCPDRLADIDKAVEAKLLSLRISRG